MVPYYLLIESNDLSKTADVKPILDKPYKTIILDPGNADSIKEIQNLPHVQNEFLKLWNEGCSCVCLISEGSILGYGWFDLSRCNYEYLSFALKDDEAYSFNFYIARHMRGRNIAAFLRNILAVHVQSMGRTRRYSIAEQFNKPTMKFKDKRKAIPHSYYIYINLFHRFNRNIKLKTMKNSGG